jgi:pimeloyl-ACP methyl ester carboxylesterase
MLAVKYVSIDGVRSAVHDSKPDTQSDAVVFVHGNPGPMDDFEALIPATSRLTRAVALDLPGFGRADHPRSFDFTVGGYAHHLGAVLDQLAVQRAHLVLHDFGGAYGLQWASQHPERVASITLINTGVLEGYRWHKFAKIWQTPLLGELFQLAAGPRMLKRALDKDNPVPLPSEYVDRVLGYADWAHKRTVLKLYRATRDPSRHFASFAPALRQLDVPVCVLWGDGDPYLPVVFAERQRETFRNAEVHVLKGLGHWPFIDDPEAVRAQLLPFLQRALASSVQPAQAEYVQS